MKNIVIPRMEHHANLLWIPLASPYNTNQVEIQFNHHHHLIPDRHPDHHPDHHDHHCQAWLDTHFKNQDRIEIAIFKTNNVLTPTALKEVNYANDDKNDNYNLEDQQYSQRGILT